MVMDIWEKDVFSKRSYTSKVIKQSNAKFVNYLGVAITRDPSWSKHKHKVCGKCHGKVEEMGNLTAVRPYLGYAPSEWDPYEVAKIN